MADMGDSAWLQIQKRLQQRITAQQYRTWFQHLQPAEVLTDGRVVLRVPNEFYREWIRRNYMPILTEAVQAVLPGIKRVELCVDPSLIPPEPGSDEARTRPAATLDGMPLNPHYTFAQFVTGPCNRLAHAAAQAAADTPGETYSPLYMHGAVGLGKSHLLQAICLAMLRRDPAMRILYLSCEMFVNDFISAIQNASLDAFRSRYRRVDALVIDDIQFLARAERTQEEFFHTFNVLHNAQKQIVLSSDSEPQDISVELRLTSRFASGLVARLDAPSLETRMAILRRKAALRQVELPDDVTAFVAESFADNIRELEGALTKLIGYASLSQKPINLSIAHEALDVPKSLQKPVTIHDIITLVAQHFRVRVADIQSKKRTRSIVYPRQICMHLARELTQHSLEEIGGYFGGRDHSTVLHADGKIRKEIARDSKTRELLAKLSRDLVSDA